MSYQSEGRPPLDQTLREAGFFTRAWFRFVRFGFRLLYNELAWTYDPVSWIVSLGRWRDWQLAALPYLSGQKILEAAHGPGHMLVELGRQGYQVVGLDRSAHMVEQARKNLSRSSGQVPLTRGDVRFLPYMAAAFDSILATFPAEFIIEEDAIREMMRVLVPGGRIVIVPEAHLKGDGILHRFIAWLFFITGQRPGYEDGHGLANIWKQSMHLFQRVGLTVAIEVLELEDSEVTLVVLSKAPEAKLYRSDQSDQL